MCTLWYQLIQIILSVSKKFPSTVYEQNLVHNSKTNISP
jgi:hypothetical protein